MTEEKDMLEQWLEYSNKGIGLNFSFNKEMLLKFLCKYKIKLMKIKYISLEDLEIKFKNEAITFLKILKAELLNEDFNYFSEYINIKLSMNQKYEDFKSRIKYHKLINILSKPLQNIQSYCYMYKQLEFKQENEWRLIIIEDNIENHDYFIKNDDFIAFKTYNYDFKYINEITLGPKNKININDIYRYLYKKGVDSCFDCKKSKINYR
jgi:DNA-directed RNA polymerase subunit L